MTLTTREERILLEIMDWAENLSDYEATDLEMTYEKWLEISFDYIPEHVRRNFFSKLDNWLFHLHATIQGTQAQMDARRRILDAARTFDEEIEQLSDLRKLRMDQLAYLADHQIAKHRLYSFAQGGLSGTGGIILGADIPAMTIINLRSVQLIAMTYGYEVNTPYEMMTSLKVFHAATLPKRMQSRGWRSLIDELDTYEHQYFFYEGSEELTDETWIKQPIKQIFKGLTIHLFRKKLIQGIPLIGMAIGAGVNYQLTRQVTDFAHKYYQYRFIKEKGEYLN
ncbi:EcsC family protein [Bacillus timonensis]|nr:EcsC family protein [Bacillus timonensis]